MSTETRRLQAGQMPLGGIKPKRPPPEPFVAMLSFAALGPMAEKVYRDGRTRTFRPVLGESRPPFGWRCATIEVAIEWLDTQKARLLAEGWFETSLDPIADPDEDRHGLPLLPMRYPGFAPTAWRL